MKSTQTHIAPHATRFASCGVRCDDGGLALGAYYDRPAVGRDEPSPAMAEQIAGAVDLYSRVRACGALAPCSRGVVVTDDDECYLSGHGEYEDRVFFGDIAVIRCPCCLSPSATAPTMARTRADPMTTHLDAIDSVKEAIKWAVAAAKEHVDLCQHTGEPPDPDISMGLWQSFQAEFPRSAYPHGHYDLLINVLSTVYSQSVKALLPS